MQAKVHTVSIDLCYMYTVEPLWKGQECLTKIAKFGPFPCAILYKSSLFYPSSQVILLKGHHHGWPLYKGSNISVSIIKIMFMTWRMNCTLNSRNSIIDAYGYSITICNFQHWWSSDSLIFHSGVVIFISASIRNAFLHGLWLLNYCCTSPWMHCRLKCLQEYILQLHKAKMDIALDHLRHSKLLLLLHTTWVLQIKNR